MIRPVDAETIQDICRDVALDNYGFLCPDGKKSAGIHTWTLLTPYW